MKTFKFILSLTVITIFIVCIIFFFFHKNYNLKKIINTIEIENNVNIVFKKKPEWYFLPDLKLKFNASLKDNFDQFNSKNIKFNFYQPYKILPLNFEIETPSFFIKGLEIKLLKFFGDYSFNKNIINIININGKIGNGKFNTKGRIKLFENQYIELEGDLENLYLNQILRQLNLADWQRIDLRLSSKKYEIFSEISNNSLSIKTLKGNIPLNGSMYFVTTEDERFGIAFLNLLVEKMFPDYNILSKSLSQIINNFSNSPSLFEGMLDIQNGIIHTSNLSVTNNKNKINLKGSYDIINDHFDAKLFFVESEKVVAEAIIAGNLKNPSISINNDTFNSEKINNDLKNVFEEGIDTLIDKLLNFSE